MKLSGRVVEGLAEMVVGDHDDFPYRSSTDITRFLKRCGLDLTHDGSIRRTWVHERLAELNIGPCSSPDLPADSLLSIFAELFDPDDFGRFNKRMSDPALRQPRKQVSIECALQCFNRLISRDGLIGELDQWSRCQIRNTGTGSSSLSSSQRPRPLSPEEAARRKKLSEYLDRASEDEFTESVLVPLFQQLGFHRVTAVGHFEKSLEFGKDLWMKFQLPTGHWIYFCAQIKKDKIDASGATKGKNVATVLAQARMAIESPIFDPETNRKVLLDHIYIISANQITRSARDWLGTQLDVSQRRHIIFMDRDEFLDQAARILTDMAIDSKDEIDDDLEPPF